MTELGRPVLTVATHDFLHPRGVRLETGADDPDAGYHRWVDHGTLHRAVLEPMTRPTRPAQVLPSLREPGTGRPTRAAPVAVPAGGVVLVHGWLVLRTELAGAFDVRVHLRADWPAVRRRTGEAGGGEHDLARPAGAWKLYQEWDFPEEVAHIVLGFDHPDRPVLLSA
ncbi:MAG: uridine kinase [Micrococcales bacterium]|nr:MAG: uridine kinase [Micrococcales bacterium]